MSKSSNEKPALLLLLLLLIWLPAGAEGRSSKPSREMSGKALAARSNSSMLLPPRRSAMVVIVEYKRGFVMADQYGQISLTGQLTRSLFFWSPMPLNISGLLVPFELLINSRLVVPSLVVKGACCLSIPFCSSQSSSQSAQKDIRCLDFLSLRQAGYRGVVFDKDNCLVCRLFPSL